MAFKRKEAHIPDFKKVAKVVRETARTTAIEEIGRFAQEQTDDFKERIQQQRFRSFQAFPLSSSTLRKKQRARADLRVMIATRTYLDSIRVFHSQQTRSAHTFRIGFHPRKRARDLKGRITPITLEEVARIQENGARYPEGHPKRDQGILRVPARPHWGPQRNRIRRASPKVRRLVAKQIAANANRRIMKGDARG